MRRDATPGAGIGHCAAMPASAVLVECSFPPPVKPHEFTVPREVVIVVEFHLPCPVGVALPFA
jgi:hypothetical protein